MSKGSEGSINRGVGCVSRDKGGGAGKGRGVVGGGDCIWRCNCGDGQIEAQAVAST